MLGEITRLKRDHSNILSSLVEGWRGRVSQNFPGNSFRPPGMFWGTIDWKYIELTSGVNLQIAMATSIIKRIFGFYKGKIYFLLNSKLRIQNKLLGKIVVG